MIRQLLGCLLIISGLMGCTSLPKQNTPQSFETFEDFWPGPEGGVDLVWAQPSLRSTEQIRARLAQYQNVVIDRVWLVVDAEQRYGSLSEHEVRALTEYLVQQLSDRIATRFNIVQTPTDNTLRLSLAITNIETPNPVLAVTSSILPFGLGVSAVSKVITGEPTNVGAATIELKVSDANTGETLFAAIDRKAGNKDFGTMVDSADDARDAIDYWVERLGVTLQSDS